MPAGGDGDVPRLAAKGKVGKVSECRGFDVLRGKPERLGRPDLESRHPRREERRKRRVLSPAASQEDLLHGPFRQDEAIERQPDGLGGVGGERGEEILPGEALFPRRGDDLLQARPAVPLPPGALGGRKREEPVPPDQAGEELLLHRSPQCPGAVLVHRFAAGRKPADRAVDQQVPRSRVEGGEDLPLRTHHGGVPDPAEALKGGEATPSPQQDPVKRRHERCAHPSRRNVRRAKVRYHGDPRPLREEGGFADLQGRPGLLQEAAPLDGIVPHRLPMAADGRHLFRPDLKVRKRLFERGGKKITEGHRKTAKLLLVGLPRFGDPQDPLAEVPGIRDGIKAADPAGDVSSHG